MVFSEEVRLVSVFFGNVQGNDGFRLSVGSDSWINQIDIPDTGIYDASTYNYVDTIFRFGTHNNDDYYIRSITVERISEPSTIVLLSLGLASVGLARRRKLAA